MRGRNPHAREKLIKPSFALLSTSQSITEITGLPFLILFGRIISGLIRAAEKTDFPSAFVSSFTPLGIFLILKKSFAFFPIGIIRKHKLSRGIFLCRQVNIERAAAWRHFHGNHNCKFSVAFIPDAVNTAVVRGFALAFLTNNTDIAFIFNQLPFSNGTVQCFIGKLLGKNLKKFFAYLIDGIYKRI